MRLESIRISSSLNTKTRFSGRRKRLFLFDLPNKYWKGMFFSRDKCSTTQTHKSLQKTKTLSLLKEDRCKHWRNQNLPRCVTAYKRCQVPVVLADLLKSSLLQTPCTENCASMKHKSGCQPGGSTCDVQRYFNRRVCQLFACICWKSSFKGELLRWVKSRWWEADRSSHHGRNAGWSRDTVAMATLPGKEKRGKPAIKRERLK